MKPKVTTKDLIGDLENFPIEIVEKMLQKQYNQFGEKDISIFQNNRRSEKGFIWENTIEGHDFWKRVISRKEFDIFFERYPKLSKKVYICGDDKLYENVIKTLERRGGVNATNYIGDGGCFYYIDPATNHIEICTKECEKLYNIITSTFEKIEPDKFIEMTLPEIAEKLGIDVEILRIKK